MPDVQEFDKTIKNVQNLLKGQVKFLIIEKEFRVKHPQTYKGRYMQIDNLVQIGKKLFLFEGKSSREATAKNQLLLYLDSLRYFKDEYVKRNFFFPYEINSTRLFYYSVRQQELVELTRNQRKAKK